MFCCTYLHIKSAIIHSTITYYSPFKLIITSDILLLLPLHYILSCYFSTPISLAFSNLNLFVT